MSARAPSLDPVGPRSIAHAPPTGSTVFATPDSAAMICCVRSAIRADFFGRQRQRLVAAVAVQRLRAAEHGRQRLNRDAHDVVVGLLRRERAAGGLRVESQLHRARSGRAEPVAHDVRPQPPRRAELRDLLDEVVVRGEEEREPLAERGRRRDRPPAPPRRRRSRSASVNATSCTAVEPASRMW